VGGELARGAFDHGYEAYGVDILRRYYAMIERDGGTFLWYHPDGRPGIGTEQTISTDGWGSSAMLSAMTEGLAGVVDQGKLYREVLLAPRWAVECGLRDKGCYGRDYEVGLEYPASGAYFAYRVRYETDGRIKLAWGGRETSSVRLHLMLPTGTNPHILEVNGVEWEFNLSRVESTLYVDALLPGMGRLELR
jgi:hypothetical protein